MYTQKEFIEKSRKKFVDEFQDMNDSQVLKTMLERFPVYKTQISDFKEKGYFEELGEKAVKGVGNFISDATNIGLSPWRTEKQKKEEGYIKLFDYQKEDKDFDGGFGKKIVDNVSDAFSTSFKATEERTKRRAEERKNNPGNFFTNTLQDFGDLGRTAFDIGGNLFKAGTDSIGDVLMSAGDTLVPDETQEDIKKYVAEQIQESETLTGIVDWFNEYQDTLEYMKKYAPEDYATHRASVGFMEGVVDLITAKVGSVAGKGIKSGLNSSVDISKNVLNKAKNTIEKLNPLKEKYFGKADFSDTFKFSKENVDAVSPVTGAKFEIEKTPGLYDNITDKIFGSSDNEELAMKSIFPKMTKEKGTQAKLEAGKRALEGVEQLYDDFANGIVKSDIHDMRGAVDGVDEALEHWGKKIGDLTSSDVEIDFSPDLSDLKKEIGVKTALFSSKVHKFGKDLLNTFDEIGNKLTVKETQEALSNIKAELFSSSETLNTFSKSSAGRKVLNFIDNLQNKLDETIEKTAGNSEEFMQARKNYSKYKKIQKDLLDSYLVDLRNSNKGLAGLAGQLGGAYEILQNPLNAGNIAKGLAFKHIGALVGKSKTRSGNWEKLIRNLDRRAVNDVTFKLNIDEAKHYTNVDSSIYKNISEVEAEKIVKKYFSDEVGVEFLENIKTPEGLEALGRYKDKLISFAKNPKENVVEHEVLHAYFDLALKKSEKIDILEKIKVEKNFKDLLDAEEFLADSFADFVIGRRNVTGISEKLKQFLEDLAFKFKKFFGQEDKVEALFRDLEDIGKGKKKFEIRSNGEIGENKFLLAGEKAKNSPKSNLELAKQMEADGKTADEIWKKTGWEKGKDEKWRFEIDDSKIEIKNLDFKREYVTVGGLIDHPELFEKYPELKNFDIYLRELPKYKGGFFDLEDNLLILNSNLLKKGENGFYLSKSGKSTLLHELQHVIQEIEGFSGGGNPNSSSVRGYLSKNKDLMIKKVEEKIKDAEIRMNKTDEEIKERMLYDDLSSVKKYRESRAREIEKLRGEIERIESGYYTDEEKINAYKKIAGETEARNISKRMDMSETARKRRRPEKTEDYSREEQWVSKSGGNSWSIENNVKRIGKNEYGPIWEGLKGSDAEDFMIKKQKGEIKNAFRYVNEKEGIDIDIDLIWGGYNSKKGKGLGYSKIIEKHSEVIGRIQDLLNNLPLTFKDNESIVLGNEYSIAVIRLELDGKSKNRLMSAYDRN